MSGKSIVRPVCQPRGERGEQQRKCQVIDQRGNEVLKVDHVT